MNSTPNPKNDLIARADEQIASAYEKIARVDEELARVSEKLSKVKRGDTVQTPPVEPAAPPPHGKPARRGLIGLLSTVCIIGIVAAFVLQLSHGTMRLFGAQSAPQLISTPSLPPNNPPSPAQPDPSPVQATAAEAAPPQAAPSSQTGSQDAATTASASELKQLLQKMTGDIANLEQAMERLKVKQDQLASDNAKAIEQLKAKQEDMARLLAKISEQSALPRTSPPPAGPTQSPQARIRPQTPPPYRRYPPRSQYYDDEW